MYNFYIDGVRLPVTPSALKIKIKDRNETVTLMNEGEINILKSPGLTEVSIDVLFPNVEYPFAVYPQGFKNASYYLTLLEKLKSDMKTFIFLVSRITPNGDLLYENNFTMALSDYEIIEDREKYGLDAYVKIKMRQYKTYGFKTYTATIETSTSESTNEEKIVIEEKKVNKRPEPDPPVSYTVKSGDSLWGICQTVLGDGEKYSEVAEINDISNPNLIYAGTVIYFG